MKQQDIQRLIDWGIRVHPCKVKRSKDGKKITRFVRDKQLVYEWKWILETEQSSADLLSRRVSKGYGLVGILSDNVAVVDCDDKESYLLIMDELASLGNQIVYEESLSHTSENMKGHFYFRTKQEMPYCKSLNIFGIKGKGEILGKNHLVLINTEGWCHLPSKFVDLPPLPEFLYFEKSKQSETKKIVKSEKLQKHDGRNNIITSFAGLTRKLGFGHSIILDVIRAINDALCDDPLPDGELEQIADSICKYPGIKTEDKLKGYRKFRDRLQELKQKEVSL
jgi:hypothetical protein